MRSLLSRRRRMADLSAELESLLFAALLSVIDRCLLLQTPGSDARFAEATNLIARYPEHPLRPRTPCISQWLRIWVCQFSPLPMELWLMQLRAWACKSRAFKDSVKVGGISPILSLTAAWISMDTASSGCVSPLTLPAQKALDRQ